MLQLAEDTLVSQAVSGDPAAFAQLVESYQAPVYNLAYRLLGSEIEAEDVAQETFLRAYSHLDSYQPTRSFRTWLLSIAAHICIDQLRHAGVLHIEGLGAYEPTSETQDPETTALTKERDRELRHLLRHLSPQSRQLIVLRYWYDLSYKEIGRIVGLSENAVKSRLHRARHQLARLAKPILLLPPSRPRTPVWVA